MTLKPKGKRKEKRSTQKTHRESDLQNQPSPISAQSQAEILNDQDYYGSIRSSSGKSA